MNSLLPQGYELLFEAFQNFGRMEHCDEWSGRELEAFDTLVDRSQVRKIPSLTPGELEAKLEQFEAKYGEFDFADSRVPKRSDETITPFQVPFNQVAEMAFIRFPEVRLFYQCWDQTITDPQAAIAAALATYSLHHEAWKRYDITKNKFRQLLYSGAATAYQFDPDTAKLHPVEPEKWLAATFTINLTGSTTGENGTLHMTLFEDGWLYGTGDGAKNAPVDTAKVIATPDTAPKSTDIKNPTGKATNRGRKPGSGSIDDSKPLARVRELMKDQGVSKWAACGHDDAFELAKGNSRDAVQKRLYGKCG